MANLLHLTILLAKTIITTAFLAAVVYVWRSAKRQLATIRPTSSRPLFIDCMHWGLLGVSLPFTAITVLVWFLGLPQDPNGWAAPQAKAFYIMSAAIIVALALLLQSRRRTDHRRAFGRTVAVAVLLLGLTAGAFLPYLNYRIPAPPPTTRPTTR